MTRLATQRTRHGALHALLLRSRWWTTLACLLAFAGGLWAAWAQHTLHALLLLGASLLLARGSVWGRRARRSKALALAESRMNSVLHVEAGDQAAQACDSAPATRPTWREVA